MLAARSRYPVLCVLLLASCLPGKFDDLVSERRTDAGVDAGVDAGDSTVDAAALDAEADSAGPPPKPPEDAGTCTADDEPRPLAVSQGPIELSRLAHPSTVAFRVIGPTAYLGSERLWVLSITRLKSGLSVPSGSPFNFPSAARDGDFMPWLRGEPALDRAWLLDDGLLPDAVPDPLLTLTDGEPNDVQLNVTSVVRLGDPVQGGIAFVQKAAGFGAPSEVWLAQIKDGATRGMRLLSPMFTAPEPLFGLAAHKGRQYLKLLACRKHEDQGAPATYPCVVARAPLERALARDAYEVYARDAFGVGSWTTDFAAATPVLYGSDTALSVGWNAYLNKFLAVHGTADNKLVLQAAASVEGPWSERVELALPSTAVWWNLYAREHPSLQQRCGKRIVVTYWSPTGQDETGFPSAGESVLSAIDLE